MAWLYYITVIGIIGIAHGNLLCFNKMLLSCNLYPKDLCRPERSIFHCVSGISKTCGLEYDKDIQDLQSFFQEMCRDGSDLNKKYKQYASCTPELNSDCTAESNKAMQKLIGRDPSVVFEEIYKIGCRFRQEISSCTEEGIKKSCGSNALSWHKEQNNLGNRLQDRLCDQLNGAERNFMPLSMWLLQAAILVFTMKWLSR